MAKRSFYVKDSELDELSSKGNQQEDGQFIHS